MDRFQQQQCAWNRETAGAATEWREHRDRLTAAVLESLDRTVGRRVSVWGFGNGNDLDLGRIVPQADSVQLVDFDAAAVRDALDRAGLAEETRLEVAAPVDLRSALPSGPPVDVVTSFGLLSQLMLGQLQANRHDPANADPATAIAEAEKLRADHLRAMAGHLRPSGIGLLTLEFVSSDTLPELTDAPAADVPERLREALAAGNFFAGLHPQQLAGTVEMLAASGILQPLRLSPPWRWNFGPRAYGVTLLTFKRPP